MTENVSTPLLSNPTLDSLYSIRRILVSRHNAAYVVGDNFALRYYKERITAMDEAIKCFIEVNSVPAEFVEAELQKAGIRIPGE